MGFRRGPDILPIVLHGGFDSMGRVHHVFLQDGGGDGRGHCFLLGYGLFQIFEIDGFGVGLDGILTE